MMGKRCPGGGRRRRRRDSEAKIKDPCRILQGIQVKVQLFLMCLCLRCLPTMLTGPELTANVSAPVVALGSGKQVRFCGEKMRYLYSVSSRSLSEVRERFFRFISLDRRRFYRLVLSLPASSKTCFSFFISSFCPFKLLMGH